MVSGYTNQFVRLLSERSHRYLEQSEVQHHRDLDEGIPVIENCCTQDFASSKSCLNTGSFLSFKALRIALSKDFQCNRTYSSNQLTVLELTILKL